MVMEQNLRDHTAIFNRSGKHVATIGLNEAHGLWQILIEQRKDVEFFCPNKQIAFAAWHEEFDPETGFPRPAEFGLQKD